MCDCFKIGGPWIAEDPNCPVHGTEAKERANSIRELRSKIKTAKSVEELADVLIELIDLVD